MVAKKISTNTSSDRIMEIATGFQLSKILFTAVEFDIFNILDKKQLTAEETAKKCCLPIRSLKRLLNGAVALGLLRLRKGKYSNTMLSMKYLLKGNPEYIGDLMTAYNGMLYDKWGSLEDVIRKDKYQPVFGPTGDIIDNISTKPETARRAMMAQHNYSVKPAQEIIKSFDFSKHSMLLDLGGGTGVFSIMAAKKNRGLKAIVFDFPPTCKIAQDMILMHGLSDRVKTHPGNILKDRFPEGADIILISGVLDGYNERNCIKIIRKAFDYLPPGGTVIIKESIINDDRTGPIFPVLFSLALLLETEGGNARSRGEMTQWLKDAGFKKIKHDPLTEISGKFRNLGILTAVK